MIKVNDLCKVFSRNVAIKKHGKSTKEDFYAVNHISFTAEKGEIIGILGPNGAGKTTLLRMLGTLMEPTQGTITLLDDQGNEMTNPIQIKQNIGYLSGNTKLYHRLSTKEMLMMLGDIYGMTKQETNERIREICDLLQMNDFIDNRIEKLSTGQTQRASIARCLIHSPMLYIFDEPTLGLDILSADAIVNFMKQQKELGKTVLYSTHYLEEAQFLCDRILMIYKGKIVSEGSPKEIMDRTHTENLREAFHSIMKEVEDGEC